MRRSIRSWAIAASLMLLLTAASCFLLTRNVVEWVALRGKVKAASEQQSKSTPINLGSADSLQREIDKVHDWLNATKFAESSKTLDPVDAVVALAELRTNAEAYGVGLPSDSMGFAPRLIAAPRELKLFLSDLASAGITRILTVESRETGQQPDTVRVSVTVECDSLSLRSLLDVVQKAGSYRTVGMGIKASQPYRPHANAAGAGAPTLLEVTLISELPAPGFTSNESAIPASEARALVAQPLLLMEAPPNRIKDQTIRLDVGLLEVVPELSPWKLVASTHTASGWRVTLLNTETRQFVTLTEGQLPSESSARLISYAEKPQRVNVVFEDGIEQEVTANQSWSGRSIARLKTAEGHILEAVEGSHLKIGEHTFTCTLADISEQRVVLQDRMGNHHDLSKQ